MERLWGQTIKGLRRFLYTLARVGEIATARVDSFRLRPQHVLMLAQSGLVRANPYSYLASPRMLQYLPVTDDDELMRRAGLRPYDWDDPEMWGAFHFRAFGTPVPSTYQGLGDDYVYTPIPAAIHEDVVTRPAWLCAYVPDHVGLQDWDLKLTLRIDTSFRSRTEWDDIWTYWEPSLSGEHFVHGVLRPLGGDLSIAALQHALWGNPFYWLAVQLLVLSDRETGAAYDWKIALNCPAMLHEPLQASGAVTVLLADRPVCDLSLLVDEVFPRFGWLWVNRPTSAASRRAALLSVLRLLMKIDVLDRRPGGRLGFTGAYRQQLFLSNSTAHEFYVQSRSAREQIRDVIKCKTGEGNA